MFKIQYFRNYPRPFQYLLFAMMIFTLGSFLSGVLAPFIIEKITGYKNFNILLISDNSPVNMRLAAAISQIFFTVGVFLGPAWLFAYSAHPQPARYLHFVKPQKPFHALLVIILIISAVPLINELQAILTALFPNKGLQQSEETTQKIETALFTAKNDGIYWLMFFSAAVLAPFAEEIFFRGILFKFAYSPKRKIIFPFIFSSLLFALVHATIYGFLSIFLAGMLLAAILYFTGSLWLSILAHAVNNTMGLLLLKLQTNSPWVQKNFDDKHGLPVWLLLLSILVFSISFYFLLKTRAKLPENWNSDFS